MVCDLTHNARPYLRPKLVEGRSRLSPYRGKRDYAAMLDLETLERCRADIEALGRELLLKERPRVARELKDLCRLLRARVIRSNKFNDVVEPLGRIAEAAALLGQQPKSNRNVASYELRHALQWLATALVDYRARGQVPPRRSTD
jgi:hypothetical protein